MELKEERIPIERPSRGLPVPEHIGFGARRRNGMRPRVEFRKTASVPHRLPAPKTQSRWHFNVQCRHRGGSTVLGTRCPCPTRFCLNQWLACFNCFWIFATGGISRDNLHDWVAARVVRHQSSEISIFPEQRSKRLQFRRTRGDRYARPKNIFQDPAQR